MARDGCCLVLCIEEQRNGRSHGVHANVCRRAQSSRICANFALSADMHQLGSCYANMASTDSRLTAPDTAGLLQPVTECFRKPQCSGSSRSSQPRQHAACSITARDWPASQERRSVNQTVSRIGSWWERDKEGKLSSVSATLQRRAAFVATQRPDAPF